MDEETKKNVLDSILRGIWHVSNKEYQRRIWIEGKGPQCDDYDETSMWILDDGKVVIKEHKQFEMTDQQYQALKKFWKEYKIFANGIGFELYVPERFIDTPEWTKVTELAQEVVKAFNYTYKYPDC